MKASDLLWCLVLCLLSASARAQDADAPTTNAVPRGAAGAVLKQPPGDTMPRVLNNVDPSYPPEAYQADIEGQVTLTLDISKEGRVLRAVVFEPGGHGFDEAALEAAKNLVFEPARRPDGTPFAARIRYRYSFTIKRIPVPQEPEKKTQSTLSGAILVAGVDAGIAGASVALAPGELTTTTDERGAFVFRDLAPGKYTVKVRVTGYQPFEAEENLSAGDETMVKYRLVPKSGAVLEITVRGKRPPREVVKRTLEQREIARIPGTNGDALKSLQSLPGVARPPSLSGVLVVRGSAPQDTQTFLDGTPVPLIYHFGGLSSVVPTEMLEKIDFYPGNFGTEYGRMQGGIVDVGLRAPKGSFHGLAQIDLIDARVLAEGPIPGVKGWSFLAGGRRSYIDAWLGPALKAAGAGVTQAPVYYDYQLMASTQPTPTSSFRVTFIGSDDAFKALVNTPSPGEPALSGNIGLHTAFMRLQTRYSADLANGDRIAAVLSFGRDVIDFNLGSLFAVVDLRSLTGRFEYKRKLVQGLLLNAGADIYTGYYDVTLHLPALPRPGEPPNGPFSTRTILDVRTAGAGFQPAAYLELEYTPVPGLRFVPGVRLDYLNINKQLDVSPRLSARFDLKSGFPRSTLKGGVGLYFQPPQFQEMTEPYGTPGVGSNRALQYSLGFEQEITDHLEGSVEGFYKRLDHQVVGTASTTGQSVVYGNEGAGYAIGSEVLLKYKPDARFFGWLAYTLSRSVRRNGPDRAEYLLRFDQTHILTVLGSYRLGHGWEIGARFRLVSGNLLTPNVCDPLQASCNPSRTNALFNAGAGVYTPIPLSGPFSERLPLFHQIDLRVDKLWKFKRWQLSAYLDVQNAYNHTNVEAIAYNFNFTARSYVTGLPILPSIGVRGEM